MKGHRYLAILIISLTGALVLILPGVLLPMASVGAPILQGTLI